MRSALSHWTAARYGLCIASGSTCLTDLWQYIRGQLWDACPHYVLPAAACSSRAVEPCGWLLRLSWTQQLCQSRHRDRTFLPTHLLCGIYQVWLHSSDISTLPASGQPVPSHSFVDVEDRCCFVSSCADGTVLPPGVVLGKANLTASMKGSHLAPTIDVAFQVRAAVHKWLDNA